MELIQIGENSLKVMLTREDMEFYDIVFDRLDYSEAETRRALGLILAEAKRQVGFSAERDNLYIQAFSDGDGGCELFVRRGDEKLSVMFAFESSAWLLRACAQLENCGYNGESRAYLDDGGAFLLLLFARNRKEFSCLGEMGRAVPANEGYLAEHAELLCDNAVETLAPLV